MCCDQQSKQPSQSAVGACACGSQSTPGPTTPSCNRAPPKPSSDPNTPISISNRTRPASTSHGVSGAASPFVIRTATLTFYEENGAEIAFELPILIARPSTPQPTPNSNWEAPSLLGQDPLRSFDLARSYNPPSVTLTETAAV